MYKVRVERHSVSPGGKELITYVIEAPRVVLAEVVTHRKNSDTWGDLDVSWCERTTTKEISKNSASSRAIPFGRMIDKVMTDPYIPLWTANQKGMQGDALDPALATSATTAWLEHRDQAVATARRLGELNVHKQDLNRVLEPWLWVTQVLTSSSWDNFFALRCDSMAHPAFRQGARMMYLAKRKSQPKKLVYGQWHLPFVPMDIQDGFTWTPDFDALAGGLRDAMDVPLHIQCSAARCAWVSYNNADKDGTVDAMRSTFIRLVGSRPVHSSPVEHQATPEFADCFDFYPRLRSNIDGWLQARKLIPDERVECYNPSEEEISMWGIDDTQLWPAGE